MVEAPGTAPGSDRLITISIYRHSWRASRPNIVRSAAVGKKKEHELAKRSNGATPGAILLFQLRIFEERAVCLVRPFVWHPRTRVLDLLFLLAGCNSAVPLIPALRQRRLSPSPAKPSREDLVTLA